MSRTKILLISVILLLTGCSKATKGKASPVAPTQPATTATSPTAINTASPSLEGKVEALPNGEVQLSTADGLTLVLKANGEISSLSIDGIAFPIQSGAPLWLRDLSSANSPAVSNLLTNPDFEDGNTAWKPFITQNTEIQIVSEASHSGANALRIDSLQPHGMGAVISQPIAVSPGMRYRISGYFKIEFGYVDDFGNPTFLQDSLYAGQRNISGLYLQWLDANGTPLEDHPQLAAPLHWNAQDWHKITREVVAPDKAAAVKVIAGAKPVSGAIWIDDLAFFQSPEADQPLDGTLEVVDQQVIWHGQAAGLQFSVAYQPYKNHIAVTVTAIDTTGAPRAFDLTWGLPMDAGGWNWWDDLRNYRVINSQTDFANSVSADITGYLPVSLYPYSAIENGATGLSLAQPLNSPRYVLLEYSGTTNRYQALAHLGISPQAAKLNQSADFSLMLYRISPKWGLRAAAEKHAAIQPDRYDSPLDFSEYADATRDHFAATGKRAESLKSLNQANVFAAQYTVFEIPLYMDDAGTPRPSFQQALDFIDQAASQNDSVLATTPVSLICDSAGEPHLKTLNSFPWSNGKWSAIWIPDVDPDLPGGFGAARLATLKSLFNDTHQAGLQIDGVFIDNFISTVTVDLCPEHLAAADLPLTYDPNTYQPGVHVASAGWEYLRQLRALLDQQPEPYRAIAINFWGLNIPTQLAPFFDAFSGEGRSNETGDNWDIPILDYRRATAMGRYRSFANQASNLSLADIQTFLNQALFYGIWPQQGNNASNWPDGWESLFQSERELVRPLLSLGWQPVTYAFSDTPSVWVERFSSKAFTVHNWSQFAVDFTLSIQIDQLGFSPDKLQVIEMVAGKTPAIQFNADTGNLEINAHLEPDQTALYMLSEK